MSLTERDRCVEDRGMKCFAEHWKIVENKAGSKGFEPPTSGLEAQRYILAKPRALFAVPIAEYEISLLT